jgi:hypothetical protein
VGVTGSTSRAAAPASEDELSEGSTGAADRGNPQSRNRWRRWLLRVLAAAFIIVAVFAAATLRLFVFPPTDGPAHVDGILSFNGSDEITRTALAVSLAEKGYAHVLLYSQGAATADTSCPKVPHVSVVCFVDVTNNTRGEAEWAGRYAERHHWRSLLIVPGRSQATRARVLVERCFSGRVIVVPPSESRPAVSDIVHQWGGLFDALFIDRGC